MESKLGSSLPPGKSSREALILSQTNKTLKWNRDARIKIQGSSKLSSFPGRGGGVPYK